MTRSAQDTFWQSIGEQGPRVRRFVMRRVGCAETAADIVQEAYLRLAALGPEARIGAPLAYLLRIADNLATDHLRRRARQTGFEAEAALHGGLGSEAAPDAALAARQQFAILQRAVLDLPPKCREVFLMHRVEGRSYREIAAALGISPRTVEAHIRQALIHCRDSLTRAEGEGCSD